MSSLVGNKLRSISSLSTRNWSAERESLIPVSSTKTLAASIAFIPIILALRGHSKVLLYLASIIS
ncbi:hypothetical protein MtrunA17_Chr4g0072391 [Medicago truncatula]|uniref:Uncharacterized protein n=1 Tax=Medicago truncatula TaxID=3880 RepID=A0A396IGR2_MEDTR|nr:hypothetical protein MtrunA17_Chr4g0072391 [Medicago truncatula]